MFACVSFGFACNTYTQVHRPTTRQHRARCPRHSNAIPEQVQVSVAVAVVFVVAVAVAVDAVDAVVVVVIVVVIVVVVVFVAVVDAYSDWQFAVFASLTSVTCMPASQSSKRLKGDVMPPLQLHVRSHILHRCRIKNEKRVADKLAVRNGTASEQAFNRVSCIACCAV